MFCDPFRYMGAAIRVDVWNRRMSQLFLVCIASFVESAASISLGVFSFFALLRGWDCFEIARAVISCGIAVSGRGIFVIDSRRAASSLFAMVST